MSMSTVLKFARDFSGSTTSPPKTLGRKTTARMAGGGAGGGAKSHLPLSLMERVAKRKDAFVQLLLMGSVLMMSMRSLSQKHRVRDLGDDVAKLRRERDNLSFRMRDLQDKLHREAAADTSGTLSSHIRRTFAAHPAPPAAAADH